MCMFAFNIHVALSYTYSLILLFKKICLFCSGYVLFCKIQACTKNMLGQKTASLLFQNIPPPPCISKSFLIRDSELADYKLLCRNKISTQIPQTATSFMIKYLFSGKVHVWSVYNISFTKLYAFYQNFIGKTYFARGKSDFFLLVKNHNGNPAIKKALINTIKESYQIRFVRIFYLNN